MVARVLTVWLALACLSCGEASLTQVVLVVDSDLAVPAELDEIDVTITRPGGATEFATALLGPGDSLPRTLTLVPETQVDQSVRVDIVARHARTFLLQRSARFAFMPGESAILRLTLIAACQSISCEADETCGETGCEPIDAELLAWDGFGSPVL